MGDPAYYSRFGFAAGDRLHFDGAPAEYFMWLELLPGDDVPAGKVDYHPAFFGG